MQNHTPPDASELPSSAQLRRSAVVAALTAAAILTAVVLPAEYGIDPTGAGRALGLTEMGEIKTQLANEAAADQHSGFLQERTGALSAAGSWLVGQAHAQSASVDWRDHVQRVLEPGEGIEIKLVMRQGAEIEFAWVANGGRLNYDLHGHSDEHHTSYLKGRGVPTHDGFLVAAFDGNHGWFWRNRDRKPVTLDFYVRGQYSEIVQE